MPDLCAPWQDIMPPQNASSWVIHRVHNVNGLGDWLSGLLSAFLLAVAERRGFYVDSPFSDGSISTCRFP